MTPPLVLRDDEGFRSIVEVDDSITTTSRLASNRTTAFLVLGPGLSVRIRSRCVNKRRITQLVIEPHDRAERSGTFL
jgi:hypothetical protein